MTLRSSGPPAPLQGSAVSLRAVGGSGSFSYFRRVS
jgi:hypothetical protein